MLHDSSTARTLSAIQAVSLRGPGRLTWFGVVLKIHWPLGAWSRETQHAYLAGLLYQQFYCYGHPVPLRSELPLKAALNKTVAEQLVAAHSSRFRWEQGWKISSIQDGFADAGKAGLRALIQPGAWRAKPDGNGKGSEIEVRFPTASFALSPGFCLITAGGSFTESDVVRLYWNMAADAAHRLISGLDSSLGCRGIPYRVKVLTNLAFAARADSCVLYLQHKDFAVVAEDLTRIYQSLSPFVRTAVPAFALELAKGLGVAEHPPGNNSFGQHRCWLLAEGLMLASEAGQKRDEDRLATVRAHFSSCGYSLEQPHLNPGSTFEYALDIRTPSRMWIRTSERGFLEAAVQIGDRLVRNAVWHANRCTWIGYISEGQQVFGSLGSDLYSGTSGIAWFLAELFHVTGKEEFRRTAEGAIRQSFKNASTSSHELGVGLYGGWAGIAYACWRCASLLNLPELCAVPSAVNQLRKMLSDSKAADIVSGLAGAILCLLLLGEEELARDYGSLLVGCARRSRGAFSWKTTEKSSHSHLTGFAHGTAGIAFSLATLYKATGCPDYREAVLGALAYERGYFNSDLGNWPDFRGTRNRREPLQYSCGWCHGAPGIALSRHLCASIFATEVENTLLSERDVALETTRAALIKGLNRKTDFCLCHGMAGNADILALIGLDEDRELVEQVGHLGLERLEADSPAHLGLMTGLAGIGHFYLRLHDKSIPSPLWISSGVPVRHMELSQ
jgi:Lanthionine synthetase C-like protein/HopA1 effector protein family